MASSSPNGLEGVFFWLHSAGYIARASCEAKWVSRLAGIDSAMRSEVAHKGVRGDDVVEVRAQGA